MISSKAKQKIRAEMDAIAPKRDHWLQRNWYYHEHLASFLRCQIPPHSSVLDIGCGTGTLLNALEPARGLGIDLSEGMVTIARKKYPHLRFEVMEAEELRLSETFDYIVIADTIGCFHDIELVLRRLHPVCSARTRLIILNPSFLWLPLLSLAEALGLKMPAARSNWLGLDDIVNLLYLERFNLVRKGRRVLVPVSIEPVSSFCNRYVAPLPLIQRLCLVNYLIARPLGAPDAPKHDSSVSVVIPARNEQGNIEELIRRMPRMGSKTELIFVEGHSRDKTWDMIQVMAQRYQGQWPIIIAQQEGKGKADAVRKGFSLATGDLLMILDADLSVPPEDLVKFYRALTSNAAELASGSRLVYPLEKESMRTLNIAGNKFFSIAFSWILDQRIKDTLCGTKAISRKEWLRLSENRGYFGDFDPFGDFDLIFGAARLNLKMVEIPIRYCARHYGATNIHRFAHGWLLLRMMLLAMRKFKWT
ncbi:MAG: glycosyltransferase [Chitinispirillaceae bacterium]|nr:glycosyltransferase [Chitinispirillaceae bacterium]